jgi:succinyl-CoA synthetase alpha subunit
LSILVDERTRVCVQGITGRDGSFHAKQMVDYGTAVVAGVTPGKGGTEVEGVPVFNTVHEAVEKEGANTSIMFVPARFAVDALYESADAGVKLIVCVSEGVPALEMVTFCRYLEDKDCRLIGPNSPGIISPGKSKVGIMPGRIFTQGPVAVISRSGTLTYEVVDHLTHAGMGQSTVVGMGGDPVVGLKFIEYLELCEADPETESVVIIGEIGGTDEENAAAYVKAHMKKKVVGFIVSGGSGTAADKIRSLKEAGIPVADQPSDIPSLLA